MTGRDGYPGTQLTSIVEQARRDAGDGKPSRRVAAIGGVLYLVVAEPARFADEVLGSLVVGFVLDDAVTRELAAITRCDVNLVADGALVATSLRPPSRRALETLVRTATLSIGGPPSLRTLEDAEYVTAVSPLGHETEPGTEGQLVLLQDWQPTRQSLRELRRQLTLGGAVIFVAPLWARWCSAAG